MQEGRGIRERGAGRRLKLVCLGVAMTTVLVPRAARAVVGHYVAGVANTHDFFVAPTNGLFFAMYTYIIYHTDSFRDRNGNPVDHLIVPLRFRPPSTLPLDVEVALSPAILWVPGFTLLGARTAPTSLRVPPTRTSPRRSRRSTRASSSRRVGASRISSCSRSGCSGPSGGST